jgi:hypothetical protein
MTPHGWAITGELLGIGLSVVANATEAQHRDHGPGPVFVAGFIPVLLFVALRILTSARIKGRKRWFLWPAFTTLATVFAITSYLDQKALLVDWSFDPLSAHLLPFGIDGLMVMSAVVLLPDATADLAVASVSEAILEEFAVIPEPEPEPIVWEPVIARPEPVTASLPEPEPEPPKEPKVEKEPKTASVGLRLGSTRAEFVERLATSKPMTVQEILDRDGGSVRSAESKAYRWRKAVDKSVGASA